MMGYNHIDKKEFGKIIDDWRCCDLSLQVFDIDQRLKYKIAGGYCQCALMCKSYETCYDVSFYIYDRNCSDETPKNALGSIIRQKMSVTKSVLTDADNFEINFPENASPYDKLMIIGATLMLDYTYFEESPGDKQSVKRVPRAEYNA